MANSKTHITSVLDPSLVSCHAQIIESTMREDRETLPLSTDLLLLAFWFLSPYLLAVTFGEPRDVELFLISMSLGGDASNSRMDFMAVVQRTT